MRRNFAQSHPPLIKHAIKSIMESKKQLNFFFLFIAIILGWTLFKHFDFKNLSLKDPVLDILYLIVFIISIFWLVKDLKRQDKK